jgi:hypothetical protein
MVAQQKTYNIFTKKLGYDVFQKITDNFFNINLNPKIYGEKLEDTKEHYRIISSHMYNSFVAVLNNGIVDDKGFELIYKYLLEDMAKAEKYLEDNNIKMPSNNPVQIALEKFKREHIIFSNNTSSELKNIELIFSIVALRNELSKCIYEVDKKGFLELTDIFDSRKSINIIEKYVYGWIMEQLSMYSLEKDLGNNIDSISSIDYFEWKNDPKKRKYASMDVSVIDLDGNEILIDVKNMKIENDMVKLKMYAHSISSVVSSLERSLELNNKTFFLFNILDNNQEDILQNQFFVNFSTIVNIYNKMEKGNTDKLRINGVAIKLKKVQDGPRVNWVLQFPANKLDKLFKENSVDDFIRHELKKNIDKYNEIDR